MNPNAANGTSPATLRHPAATFSLGRDPAGQGQVNQHANAGGGFSRVTPTSTSTTSPGLYRALVLAVASRLYYLFLAWSAHQLAPDFDASSDPDRDSVLIKWDALHFESIAASGYQHELQLAFFPLVPAAARAFASVTGVSVGTAGVVWSNCMFLVAVLAFYKLTLKVTSSTHSAFSSAILFSIQPASIFLMSMYTEPTFGALSFLGMLAWEHQSNVLAALSWCLACCTRSNALLHAGFFVYGVIFCPKRRAAWPTSVLGVVAIGASYLAVQTYGTYLFCSSSVVGRPSWCPSRASPFPIAFPYSHIQAKYWNVGLFRYWTLSNLPNFFIALPILTHSLVRIWRALVPRLNRHRQSSWPWRIWLVLSPSSAEEEADLGPAYHVQHLVLVLVAVCGMHVQVAVRMFSSIPGVFVLPPIEEVGGRSRWRSWWVVYSVVWSSVGAVLFGLFYPPA